VVLSAERPPVHVPGVHREHHRGVAEELVGWPREEGAGEDPQGSLGCAGASPRSRSHLSGSNQAVSCPRSCAGPEVVASPLRDDDRSAPWEGTVTAPSLPSLLEVQHRVAQAIERSTYSWPPSWLLPMLPNAGTEKIVSHYLLDASCLLLS
jgi:hypothetical protein